MPSGLRNLLAERAGFGADVTGGADGCLYYVTNDNARGDGSLREGLERGNSWILFDGDYSINLCSSEVRIASNTTIDGRGRDVTIRGGELVVMGGSENVIITDLTIRDSCGGGQDLLDVSNGGTRFWFHHLTLRGASDEYINIAAAREGRPLTGTISWVRFERATGVGAARDDELTVLIGDGQRPETNHLIRVTLHHNYFDGTLTRNPSVNGAVAHLFNNVIAWRLKGIQAKRENSDGVRSDQGAEIVSEYDVFDARYAGGNNYRNGVDVLDSTTRVRVEHALLLNGAQIDQNRQGQAFDPSSFYSYSPDSAESAAEAVPARAGVR